MKIKKMGTKCKVLIVGQTPPPYGGQAMMIKYLVDHKFQQIETYHVRMCFSRGFNERGKFSLYKVIHIFAIILNIWLHRIKYKTNILYYPPSSSPKVAVIRDGIILLFTRFLFKKTIYHFHAAGISEELPKYNKVLQKIIFKIIKSPDVAITSSIYNPKDGEFINAKKNVIIPLGIPDLNTLEERKLYAPHKYITILFMGLLNSTKGEGYVLDAVHLLSEQGYDIHLNIAGRFESSEYETDFNKRIEQYGLVDKVSYRGVVTGEDKKNLFLESDIFCFPSFFNSESFGIVLLEGMMYQMPLIASKWRGIQSVVEENKNGFLVDVKNAQQIASCIRKFYNNRSLIETMGRESRNIFKQKYEIRNYLNAIENSIINS